MKYEPKFGYTARKDMGGFDVTALWVKMPNGRYYNIWDVSPDVSNETLQAIQHAFELGFMAHEQLVQAIGNEATGDAGLGVVFKALPKGVVDG